MEKSLSYGLSPLFLDNLKYGFQGCKCASRKALGVLYPSLFWLHRLFVFALLEKGLELFWDFNLCLLLIILFFNDPQSFQLRLSSGKEMGEFRHESCLSVLFEITDLLSDRMDMHSNSSDTSRLVRWFPQPPLLHKFVYQGWN